MGWAGCTIKGRFAISRGCALLVAAPLAVAGTAAAATPIYRTPGYAVHRALPKVAPVAPAAPVSISGDGSDAHVLVDGAGTAHIAWSENPVRQASIMHYCRLLRGAGTCAAPFQDTIMQRAGGGNDPATDVDFAGPFPLAIGNELALLDGRCCNNAVIPGGKTTGTPDYLFTSENGGDSFTGPTDPNSAAGTIGDLEPSGNAVVFNGNDPYIGIISDTMTGGTFFQGVPGGQYTGARANLSLNPSDQAYDGRLAVDGTRPIAAFDDLSGNTIVREWNGQGSVNDAANWSSLTVTGAYSPRIVSGPSGTFLFTHTGLLSSPLQVRPISAGGASAGAPVTLDTAGNVFPTASEDPNGTIAVAWLDRESDPSRPAVHVRTSTDGIHWNADQVVAVVPGGDLDQLSVSVTADGGGFVTFRDSTGSPGIFHGKIDAAQFGPVSPTGHPGLGLQPGGAGPPAGDQSAYATCTDVHFGAIDALAESGCFLRDPSNPTSGAAVTDGEIKLNGLEIIPDAGVKIAIDPRLHTINTTGSVSVNLRAPGLGDITLWHGELHADLAGALAGVGQNLFNFDTSKFAPSLEGFPIDATIDVKLTQDGVQIPISLKLPAYMGGVSGAATLLADNTHGLDLQSLHIGVDQLELGALEINHLHIDYTEQGNVWQGGAMLNIPGGSPYFGIDVQVRFDDGAFTMGSFNVTLPYPGIPVFTDVYLAGFGGGFDIRPPRKRFFGSVTAGAIPLDPPNYALTVTGTVSITFIDNGPVILEVDGSGAVHNIQVAQAKLVFQTNGYLEVDGSINIDLDIAGLQGGLQAFADLPAKEFSADAHMQLSLFGYGVSTAEAVISTNGIAACGSFGVLGVSVDLGFGYRWGESAELIGGLGGCDLSAYKVQPVSNLAAESRGVRAHEAVASLQVPGHTPFEDVLVTGSGAPPSVLLTAPNGQQVVATHALTAGSQAVAIPVAKRNQTLVILRKPAAGRWSLAPAPGSSSITAVSSATGMPRPSIQARVVGSGHHRRLLYHVTARPDQEIAFAESAHGVYKRLGTARGARGSLAFTPADGPAGTRSILAIISAGGVPRQRIVLTRYHAPAPATPGTVRGLHVRVHGAQFGITFGSASAAARYAVRIAGSDGRHLIRLLGARGHTLTLPAIGYSDRLTVSVTGRSAAGRSGRATSASATYMSAVSKCAKLSPKQRRRHHCAIL